MATFTNIDPAKNMQRFYSVRTVPTPFGEWCVMREWGRIGSPGPVRLESYGTEDAAREEEQPTIRTRAPRLQHGFHMTLRLPPEAIIGPEAFGALPPYMQRVFEAIYARPPSHETTPPFFLIPAPSNDDERAQLERLRRIWSDHVERGELPEITFHLDHGGTVQ
jgi:predicted DNA-binding WGR domain protein